MPNPISAKYSSPAPIPDAKLDAVCARSLYWEFREACIAGKSSFCLIVWEENYPGAEMVDKVVENVNLDNGLDIQWERTDAPNTGKVELLFYWD